MEKIKPIMTILILVLSGVAASAIPVSNDTESVKIIQSFNFSTPVIQMADQYASVHIQETTHVLQDTGKPELPMKIYSLDLPFGAKNIQISCNIGEIHNQVVQKKIRPTPEAVVRSRGTSTNCLAKDTTIYLSKERYPGKWYDVKISCGLNSNRRVTHISFYLYPVQYSPALDTLHFIDEATITVTYESSDKSMVFDEEYDLVIIAPQKFASLLDPLVIHKNDHHVRTFLKTTEDIYSQYTGNDPPEQIKYFIKDAIETHNISYVLLVGGLKSYYNARDRDDVNQGSKNWHVPVRYTNIKKTGLYDPGAISDLYYADIYKWNNDTQTWEFEDWDSNDDGYYANWRNVPGAEKDDLDLNPDVFVGRLPCRKKFEVSIVVKKIINYEQTSPSDKPWYSKMIGIGGLSHNKYHGQPDGEYLCDLAFENMTPLIDEEVKVYASNNDTGGPIPVPLDIISAFGSGAGYVIFEGHGHPLRWATHPVEGTGTWMAGIHMRNIFLFFNFKKLPLVLVGGCHNAQFNVTWYRTKHSEDYNDFYWTHGDPGCECFCWRMVVLPWGGAIASVGATGLTTSWSGQPVSLNGEIEMNFFYQIGKGITTPGEALSGAIQKFIDENTIELTEAHSVTIPHLLGDPSLQLGGFI
ncbi:MAG: C25 family cysteine peptidase [Petrotogales bacterium]